MAKTTKNTTKAEKPVKRAKNGSKGMFASLQSYLALILLAGLAYEGVVKLLEDAPEAVATALGILTVILLTKTALKL